MKTCSKCKIKKDEDEFYKDKTKRDSLTCECKDCKRKYQRGYRRKGNSDQIYYQKNKEKIKEKRKKYQQKNKEKIRRRAKKYCQEHREKIREYKKEYRKKNKEKERKYNRKRLKNGVFRLNRNISKQIWRALKENKNGRHWETLVGYTLNELRKHLEAQFEPWMSWDNYGKWHIDHRIPKSLFNYKTPEDPEFKECWALKNLQPMEAMENIRKGNRCML